VVDSGRAAYRCRLRTLIGQIVLYLRRERREAFGLDEFLTLGLIGLSYGIAVLAQTYGFLSAFAAGLVLRTVERKFSSAGLPATQSFVAPGSVAEMATESRPRANGGNNAGTPFLDTNNLWFVTLLLLVIRPLAVLVGIAGCGVDV
jgi:sodium/hydrogen antiporter